MFDIEKFYRDAEAGEKVDEAGFLSYLQEFENVIIWGAGNLGTALGKKLLEMGVKLTAYWDSRYDEIKLCNEIPVLDTFSGDFSKEDSIVIIGIVNGTLSHKWQVTQLKNHGFHIYILGMQTYEGIGCSMRKDTKFDVSQCTGTSICNFNTCKKYMKLFSKDCGNEDTLSFQLMDLIVSHRCTLDCLHCGQRHGFIRRQTPEHYIDYPLEQIKMDLDVCMDNIDAVGTISVIGGEPFIHPQIADIIEHCLTKKNLAIISITTNGICKLTDELLTRICNARVKINFSNYTGSLDDKMKRLFEENVEKVRRSGLNCNVSTPIWSSVEDLKENPDFSPEYLTEVRRKCVEGPTICNGIFYVCPPAEVYDKTNLFSVDGQFLNLHETKNVREEIKRLVNRPYYEVCGGPNCGNPQMGHEVIPGEQYKD